MTEVTITTRVELTVMECGTCGVAFAMPETLLAMLQKEAGWFWCPNGHQRGWAQGTHATQLEAEREKTVALRAELDRERRARLNAENAVMDAAKEAKRRARRAKAGMCQECHRTFQNYSRHMATQHP